MQTLTFHNQETDQKVIIEIDDAGDDWNINTTFSPDLWSQDKESLHYMAANIILSRLLGKVDPKSVSLS